MPAIPSFSDKLLQAICDILADTSDGLSGVEISLLLKHCNIAAPESGLTKRHRLYQALSKRQSEDGCANQVIHFIQSAMHPSVFRERPRQYDFLRYSLNQVLSEVGFQVGMDGKFTRLTKKATGADQRASQLYNSLLPRNLHPEVMRLCQPELMDDHYLPLIMAAAQSLCEKIRMKSGLEGDGLELVDQALNLGLGPKLAFNTLQGAAEISEHVGLLGLIKNVISVFDAQMIPPPSWEISQADAIDLLTLISMLHRRLDQTAATGR